MAGPVTEAWGAPNTGGPVAPFSPDQTLRPGLPTYVNGKITHEPHHSDRTFTVALNPHCPAPDAPSSRLSTPRVAGTVYNTTRRVAPKEQIQSSVSDSWRKTPIVKLVGSTKSKNQVDEDFLVSARQVDDLINAIHGKASQDYRGRLEYTYNALSGGMNLPNADDETYCSIIPGARRKPEIHVDRSPVTGVVPGVVSPRTREPDTNRKSPRASRKSKASPRSTSGPQHSISISTTPWGPDRANFDYPPRNKVLQKKQTYCEMLDQQTAEKSDHDKIKNQKEKHINTTTHTSLETSHHSWGQASSDANRERAIYRELLDTVDYRQQKKKAESEADRQDGVRIAESLEKQMAWQYHVKREEDKQEKHQMGSLWKAAAQDRRRLEEAQKAADLQEEKDTIEMMNTGKVPGRRVRRPKEECLVMHNMLAPPRRERKPELTPITAW